MPRYKVGGQASFVTEVRAKDPIDAERKALNKAWREGAFYIDSSSVQRITRKNGKDILMPEDE